MRLHFYSLNWDQNDSGMKNLIMLRHAKSDWTSPGQKDFDRVLNARGHRVAPRMGHKLNELEIHVDVIISSPAERAKLTAEYVAEQLNYDTSEIEFVDDIYEASIRTLLEIVNNIDEEYDTIMMVGHNPSFTYLAEYLTGEEIGNIPTCGAVSIDFEITSWKEVSQNGGILKWFMQPKQFDL